MSDDQPGPQGDPAPKPRPAKDRQGRERNDRGQRAGRADLRAELRALGDKLDEVVRLLQRGNQLQRRALLGPEAVLDFVYRGIDIRMALPNLERDLVQRTIMSERAFFEQDLLEQVAGMGLIDHDSLVCDVGANIGNHSVFFGRVLGARRVLGFEPQPHVHGILRRNLALNGLDPEGARQVMVGASSGAGRMLAFSDLNMGATTFEPFAGGPVPMTCLDDALAGEDLEHLDFIKIDVEGMQAEVLRGAQGVLSRHRPAVWVEVRFGYDAVEDVTSLLAPLGYEMATLSVNDFLFRKA